LIGGVAAKKLGLLAVIGVVLGQILETVADRRGWQLERWPRSLPDARKPPILTAR
jgi:hypothetical protein